MLEFHTEIGRQPVATTPQARNIVIEEPILQKVAPQTTIKRQELSICTDLNDSSLSLIQLSTPSENNNIEEHKLVKSMGSFGAITKPTKVSKKNEKELAKRMKEQLEAKEKFNQLQIEKERREIQDAVIAAQLETRRIETLQKNELKRV